MDLDVCRVADGLGLTRQQFDILQCVYRLQSDGVKASPKRVQEEYRKLSGKHLMKANLFKVLKVLRDKGHLVRSGYGAYVINFEGVKNSLDRRRMEYEKGLGDFNELAGEVEGYFLRLAEETRVPRVEYLKYEPFFEDVTEKLQKAKSYYITSKFPGIAYTLAPYANIGRGEYVETLWNRCLEKRDLQVDYLTCLDPEYPYTHSMKLHGNKNKALRECETVFSKLQNQVSNYENLNVYYLKNPYGLDIILPVKDKPEDVYFFIRNAHMDVSGGIHVKSRDIASRAQETFHALCTHATLLKDNQGNQIIDKKHRELHRRYGRQTG